MDKLNFQNKKTGDQLQASEWNSVVSKIDELVDSSNNGGGSSDVETPIDTSGMLSVSSKGNVSLGNNNIKNINLEPGYPCTASGSSNGKYGDIALKPGDDIQFLSHHREPKKRDKVVLKIADGSDNPVKFQTVAGEIELAVGTSANPKTATLKKDKTTGEDINNSPMFKAGDAKVLDVKVLTGEVLDSGTEDERDERAYLKVRAQAIDLRCEKHGGIALQPKGYDSDGNMNKIKFEHGGGDGLEFGTFNSEKTSIFTDEYRFNKHGIWKMAKRDKTASGKNIIDEGTIPQDKVATGSQKYVKNDTNHQKVGYEPADDFYDFIDVTDEQCKTKDIIKTAYAMNGHPCVHTKITNGGNLEIGTSLKYKLQAVNDFPSGVTSYFAVATNFIGEPPIDIYENDEVLHTSWVKDDAYLTVDELTQYFSFYPEATEPNSVDENTVQTVPTFDGSETIYLDFKDTDLEGGAVFGKRALIPQPCPDIKLDSGAKLQLKGILDFGSSFNFGETDNGIEVQYKLTKKNATKDCGVLKVVGVNNHATNDLTVEGVTIAPGQTEVIAQCSLLDIIKLVNYMKTNNEGPWAPQP